MVDCWQLVERLLRETLRGEPLAETYTSAILRRLDRWSGAASVDPSVANLPLLTCQAVGGTSEQSAPVLAAWQMLHIAAKLFDDIEDGDADDPAADLNIATAALVIVPLLLDMPGPTALPLAQTQRITRGAHRAVLLASAGQHADLLVSRASRWEVDPERWLAIAKAKSGALLGWAAWAGAAAGGADETSLARFAAYGEHLGVLLQIADDFAGIWKPEQACDLTTRRLSLPVCYALSVVPVEERSALQGLLERAAERDARSQAEARQRLIELGAQAYIAVTGRVFQQHALATLQELDPARETTQPLVALVADVFPGLERLKLL